MRGNGNLSDEMDLVGYKFQRKKWKLHGEVTSMHNSVVPSVSLPVHV